MSNSDIGSWSVVIFDDGETPVSLIIKSLVHVFHVDLNTASQGMIDIRRLGSIEFGPFTLDIAQTKVSRLLDYAESSGHSVNAITVRRKRTS